MRIASLLASAAVIGIALPVAAQPAPTEEPPERSEAPAPAEDEPAARESPAPASPPAGESAAPDTPPPSDNAPGGSPPTPPAGEAPAARERETPAPAGAPPPAPPPAESARPSPPPASDAETGPWDEPVIDIEAGPGPPAGTSSDPDVAASDLDEAPEIVVAGTRASQMAGAVQVIGKEQLERVEYDNPHDVLRQVPGLYLRVEDGMGLRPNIGARGVNPDRSKKLTLMEDGILFGPAPYSAPAAYYFPMITRMTAVRVIKGPSAVAYGPQTVAGAIDLVTRPIPAAPALGADLAYGSYGYRKAHAYAGTSDEQFGFLAEGVYVANNGFKDLPSGANTGAARSEVMVKGSYLLDPTADVSHEFSVKLGYSQEASNETYLGLTDADFHENPNRRYPASDLDRMDNHRMMGTLTHEVKSYEDHYSVRTTLYRQDFHRIWRKFNHLGGAVAADVLEDPDDPSNNHFYEVLAGQANSTGPADALWIGPNQRDFVSEGIFSLLRWDPTTGPFTHRVEAGLRLHYDSIERDHSEESFQMFEGELYPLGQTSTTTLNKGSTFALALHAIDAITWRRLTFTPGVRVENIFSKLEDYLADTSSKRTVVAVMPGAGLYYGLTDQWGLLGGVYRGFSPPPPGGDDEGGGASVQPEYSINYEVGTRFARRGSKAELIGFLNDYSNITDVCTFSNGCLNSDLDRQFDGGRALTYGLEALLTHDLDAGPVTFPLQLAYTLSFSEFQNTFESGDPIYGSVVKGDELPYIPRHQFNAMLAAEFDRYEIYGLVNYVSSMREIASTGNIDDVLHTDPLVTLDLGASARVLDWLKLYVNGRNILDYQAIMAHRPFGARPNAPLWIQGGAKVELD